MPTSHDPNVIIPLYEKSGWQSRSPLRRIVYLWRTKPLVRWAMLMSVITFMLVASFQMRTHPFSRVEKKEEEKKPEIKPSEWEPCPLLIAELDELRGPDYRYPHEVDSSESDPLDESKWARILSAEDLLAMAKRGEKFPQNIIHQSWKRHYLPKDFDKWSKDWRRLHGKDWVYVLWVDDDNRQLIKTYYPEYLETYNALPREIYRADMVRNAYMHRFGGVYADLDLVPLVPLQDQLPILHRDRSDDPFSVVYLGHMGAFDDRERWRDVDIRGKKLDKIKGKAPKKYGADDDEDDDDWDIFEHSVPNAFMVASKPGHPLWLQAMDYVKDHLQYVEVEKKVEETSEETGELDKVAKTGKAGKSGNTNLPNETEAAASAAAATQEAEHREVILLSEPEKLTGPVALKKCVKKWNKPKNQRMREGNGVFDQVVVLSDGKIYPFSWYDGSMLEKCVCRRHSPHKDEKMCNSLYPDAWTITYWTHSWGD